MKIKKLIILNIPYVFLGLYATKLAQGWRLAEGINASQKFLNYMAGLGTAMQSPLLSFHPGDLVFGIIVGAAIRLAIYIKGKNTKKFRKNMEYGSARWGTAEDIAPFIDPDFRKNIILTQTERLMMSNRPKNPANARNKDDFFIL